MEKSILFYPAPGLYVWYHHRISKDLKHMISSHSDPKPGSAESVTSEVTPAF
jgi:hypothetical protein